MRDIKRIYIHCTASTFGNVQIIDEWHRERGFEATLGDTTYHIGYHFLVLNGHAKSFDEPMNAITDGQVVTGRPIELIGAHVKGDNTNSIGIAYVGFSPTPMQMNALLCTCHLLRKSWNLAVHDVLGHHEFYLRQGKPTKKTCPNFDMGTFRDSLTNSYHERKNHGSATS